MAAQTHLWKLTPSGSMEPVPIEVLRLNVPDESERERLYIGCGRMCGICLFHGFLLGAPLAENFLQLVQQPDAPARSLTELQQRLNEQLEEATDYRGDGDFLARTLSDQFLDDCLTFTRTLSVRAANGQLVEVPLKAGGEEEVVTNETKMEWLRSTLQHKLVDTQLPQARAFRRGVLSVLPAIGLDLFSSRELKVMLCGEGIGDAQLALLQAVATVHADVAQQTTWLFEVLGDYSPTDRAKLYAFVTGSKTLGHVPDTQAERDAMEERVFKVSAFYVRADGAAEEEVAARMESSLPRAHTCFNELELPAYSSKAVLAQRIRTIVDFGSEGFGEG